MHKCVYGERYVGVIGEGEKGDGKEGMESMCTQ